MWETQVQSPGQMIPWSRKQQPTPAFLLGELRGQRAWQATVHGVRHDRVTVTLQRFLVLSWQNAPVAYKTLLQPQVRCSLLLSGDFSLLPSSLHSSSLPRSLPHVVTMFKNSLPPTSIPSSPTFTPIWSQKKCNLL